MKLLNGEGVPQDMVAAYSLFSLSAARIGAARRHKEKLEELMTPEQIADGEEFLEQMKNLLQDAGQD